MTILLPDLPGSLPGLFDLIIISGGYLVKLSIAGGG